MPLCRAGRHLLRARGARVRGPVHAHLRPVREPRRVLGARAAAPLRAQHRRVAARLGSFAQSF